MLRRQGPIPPSPQPRRPATAPWPAARAVVVVVTATALFVSGCVTRPVTEITLSGIVRGSNPVKGTVPAEVVRVARGNALQPAAADTLLQPGDEVWTGPDTAAVISFPGGARAYLRPGTHVRVGSLFLDFGRVFVKVKGAFRVSTTFITAASEGTEYWVDARPQGTITAVVIEGRVRYASATGAWPSRVLGPGEYAVVRGPSSPQQGPADPAEMRRETDWANSMDRMVPVKTGVSPWAIGAGAAAIAIGIGLSGSGGDSREQPRDGQPRDGQSSPTSSQPGRTTTTTTTQPPRTRTPPPPPPPVVR